MLKKFYFNLIILFTKVINLYFQFTEILLNFFLNKFSNLEDFPNRNFKFNIKNYNEKLYLLSQPDVMISVKSGYYKNGFHHFVLKGKKENRVFYNQLVLNVPKIKLILAYKLQKKTFQILKNLKTRLFFEKKQIIIFKKKNLLELNKLNVKNKSYITSLSRVFLLNIISYINETRKYFKYDICLLLNREIFFYLFKKSKNLIKVF